MPFLGSSIVGAPQAVTQEIFNVTLGAVDTEQSQLLSSGTIVGYMIKTRGTAELKVTHVSSESGTKYVTIPSNAVLEDKNRYTNLTLYFQSPQTGDTVEIVAWKI